MENERTIANLYARRKRLILGLQDFERRAEVYRSALAEVEAKLQKSIPFVSPFKPRKRFQYFTSSEFIRGLHDALRGADGEVLTPGDIVTFLMQRKGMDVSDAALRQTVRRRVLGTLRRMKRHSTNSG